MSLLLTDSDQWYDEYDDASPKQQYALVREAIAQPIPVEFAEAIDLGMVLVEVYDLLANNNQVEEVLAFTATLQQHNPDIFQGEFQYFDKYSVLYGLFHGQIDAVSNALVRYRANPVQGIEELIELLYSLEFYGALEPLLDLCAAVYEPIAISPDIIRGAEIDFGAIWVNHQFEQTYRRIQQGEAIDWKALSNELSVYGFKNNTQVRNELEQGLTTPTAPNPEFLHRFKRNRQSALRRLSLGFSREMLTQQMSFVCSQAIWTCVIDALEWRERPQAKLNQPNRYFAITETELDAYLAKRIMGLLSSRYAEGFALIWGIPLVYEFLASQQIVETDTAEEAIAAATALKLFLTKACSSFLWQLDFVHRWPRPQCVSEPEFAAEAEQFRATITQAEPLSDDPEDHESFTDMIDRAAETLANKLEGTSIPKFAGASPFGDDDLLPHTLPTSTWKPPKPRKSPLQEAGELRNSKPPKKERSGKKKKGFS